ncbi:SMP-30/gluconolactonase/LRE family protein [Parapusillimonas sp. SGNA-6]|uniref:SMP-30/gluconolactonase/LRE family protein n=1 Tax=Parapedobacter sp. SGR-10 TaxID=2710879 RepID=UPI0013D4BCCF|nr:SMP-30/gluconolactonase/LRE family protein [Parapedobacter sp. SGR-10]NGF57538.1 SMP-30/gluconolactonase/LRE family protein [Parapedobacter sp. SGR-10]NGM89772.1 SMP-30/gluconolactonase/LRE family protein [Parapusillimonas sp. SGNA-6]
MQKLFLSFMMLSCCSLLSAQTVKLKKMWEAKEQLPVPESVLYDAYRQVLFVSLIDGAGNAKDGKGGIAQLNKDGSLKNVSWITGLNAPKGMALYKDILYVADITAIVLIDVVTGNIIDEIEVPRAVFLNDVTVDQQGAVYVSDTRENKIYCLRDGKVSLFLENVESVNGLKSIGSDLYALAGKELWKIDAQKKITVLAKGFEQNGDGLEPVGNGDFLVTCWAGIIYYVKADGQIEKLQDVQGKMNTADLGYDADNKVIYIPTFNNNSVIAYTLQ